VGLHRGVIHRTYRAPRWLECVLALLFIYSGLGGPLSWARLHATRDYWQNDPRCPNYFAYRHSIARDFIWNLHMRFEPSPDAPDPTTVKLDARALRDPWLIFLERTWPLHNLLLAIVVYVVGGPNALAVCICARTAAGILGHWFVGYAAHAWGERRFVVANAVESGTNVWPLGVLSFGEGFHNNHHAFSWSARFGMRWHEVDLGWLVIRFLEVLGVVDDVRAWSRAPDASTTVVARWAGGR